MKKRVLTTLIATILTACGGSSQDQQIAENAK